MDDRERPALELPSLDSVARAVGAVRGRTPSLKRMVGSAGFPWRAPTVPESQQPPKRKSRLGADYETEWARKPVSTALRTAITEGPMRLVVKLVADPDVHGVDRLADLRRLEDPPSVIFTPNHQSHLDTPLVISSVPEPWRHRLVVAAAADYFFTTHLASAASALVLNAIPLDRGGGGRHAADLARELLDDGWSLVIYPEGGRSPDGWGQPFKGGAAFISRTSGAPVVPVHLEGTGQILGKGSPELRPGRTRVTFGPPLHPDPEESSRHYIDRIEQAVAELADEARSDWWSARQRAAAGTTPTLGGPEHASWRRAWELDEHRRRGPVAKRRRQQRRWPRLG